MYLLNICFASVEFIIVRKLKQLEKDYISFLKILLFLSGDFSQLNKRFRLVSLSAYDYLLTFCVSYSLNSHSNSFDNIKKQNFF